jgi:hypothetical protein
MGTNKHLHECKQLANRNGNGRKKNKGSYDILLSGPYPNGFLVEPYKYY